MNRSSFISFFKREKPTYGYSPMRFIYKILRLFYCPHRWTRISTEEIVRGGNKNIVAEVRTFRCRHCGVEETKVVRFDI